MKRSLPPRMSAHARQRMHINSFKKTTITAICAACALVSSTSALAFDVDDLTADQGYVIDGPGAAARSGFSVNTAGDVNGDGINDMIIGSENRRPYVVFGTASGIPDGFSLADVNGANGFAITNDTAANDQFGFDVTIAGDLNGDGIDDMVIGAPTGGNDQRGLVYVIFGSSTVASDRFDVADLVGSNGYTLTLLSGYLDSGHGIGYSVASGGDVDGDGIDDLVIGAPDTDTLNDNSYYIYKNAGRVYVVYGSTEERNESIDLGSLDDQGYWIDGGIRDRLGFDVGIMGDTDGDGLDDMFYTFGSEYSVNVVVEFGGPRPAVNNIDGRSLEVVTDYYHSDVDLYAGAAGDINADGLDDLVVMPRKRVKPCCGDERYQPKNLKYHVLFGSRTRQEKFMDVHTTLDGTNGFNVEYPTTSDVSAPSLSGQGDVNGDGIDDLVIGHAFPADTGRWISSAQVIFGRSNGFPATINANEFSARNGVSLYELLESDEEPVLSISSGSDIDGDGVADISIGLPSADANVGQTVVIKGGDVIGNLHEARPEPVISIDVTCTNLRCVLSPVNENATGMFINEYTWDVEGNQQSGDKPVDYVQIYGGSGTYSAALSVIDTSGRDVSTTARFTIADTDIGVADICPEDVERNSMWGEEVSRWFAVPNLCTNLEQRCSDVYFHDTDTRSVAICEDYQWKQKDKPEDCPYEVYVNDTVWLDQLNGVAPNACTNDGQVCKDAYFEALDWEEVDAICSAGKWVANPGAPQSCPRGIFEDGKIYDANNQYIGNSCSSVGQVCGQVYFYGPQRWDSATCKHGKWRLTPRPVTLDDMTPSTHVDPASYGTDCKAYASKATKDNRWKQSNDTDIDEAILGGNIVAYNIRWSSGQWSSTYTPGAGDVDWVTTSRGDERLVWSYFVDHSFRFVICGVK